MRGTDAAERPAQAPGKGPGGSAHMSSPALPARSSEITYLRYPVLLKFGSFAYASLYSSLILCFVASSLIVTTFETLVTS
jgi:hypothetical protein